MRNEIMQQFGVQLAPMKFDEDAGAYMPVQQNLPPQIEQQIAVAIAQWETQQLQQLQQMVAQQQGQGGGEAQAKAQGEMLLAQTRAKIEDEKHQNEMRHQIVRGARR
jgi:hypothetical protein